MKILQNVDLSKYTTFKMGGNAMNFYQPETEEELINLVKTIDNYKIIGGGSNLLINDKKDFKNVISLTGFNDKIIHKGEGEFTVGASVRLQKLINKIIDEGYGGIEYLYSVPGLIGGAVCMNAGRGEMYKKSISDYIKAVKVLYHNNVKIIGVRECEFNYRDSIFKNDDYIILEVYFQFNKINIEIAKALIKERIDFCKKKQDNSYPNFGTVYSKSNKYIMDFCRITGFGKRNKIQFSKKTNNWILNIDGDYYQVITLLKKVELLHKIFRKDIKREVHIWN